MEVANNISSYSDLPEMSRQPDYAAYKFSVPDGPQPHATVYASPHDATSPTDRHGKWKRWPLLLIYGLLLATIAGLIGGFIGKTIERSNHKSESLLENDKCPNSTTAESPSSPSSPSSSSSSSSTLRSATPTPSTTVFQRVIPQPASGCDSTNPYQSFKSRSNMIKVPYTTICGQGWLSDDIGAISVASQSDCIESCSTHNSYAKSDERRCVGAGFIPEWWNQTQAMVESKIAPYNCFLKANTTGIERNSEKFEVIALCLGNNCDNISG